MKLKLDEGISLQVNSERVRVMRRREKEEYYTFLCPCVGSLGEINSRLSGLNDDDIFFMGDDEDMAEGLYLRGYKRESDKDFLIRVRDALKKDLYLTKFYTTIEEQINSYFPNKSAEDKQRYIDTWHINNTTLNEVENLLKELGN